MNTINTRIRYLLAVLIVAVPAFGTEPIAPDDLKQLQGTWTVESAAEDGKPIPPLIGALFIFDGDKLTIQMSNGKALPALVKLQPPTSLKRISIEPHPAKPGCTSQNNAYELTGDTFTLVQATPPKLPADLSDEGQQRLVLKRKRP